MEDWAYHERVGREAITDAGILASGYMTGEAGKHGDINNFFALCQVDRRADSRRVGGDFRSSTPPDPFVVDVLRRVVMIILRGREVIQTERGFVWRSLVWANASVGGRRENGRDSRQQPSARLLDGERRIDCPVPIQPTRP